MNAWDLFRKAYGTRLDQSQVINWTWFDTQTYTSAATVLLTFFNAVRATKDLGNMELAGVLAHPKAFIIRAIGVYFRHEMTQDEIIPGAANDIARLINNGWAQLEIGNKNYGVWPIHRLPAGGGVWSDSAGAGTAAANAWRTNAQNGIPDPRAIYALSQPMLIDPQINFNFTLQWTTAQTLSGNIVIEVDLDGELMRPVQ